MMTLDAWTAELRTWLNAKARSAGFDLAGVAPVPGPADPSAARDAQRFAAWVDAGRADEMDYLTRRDESGTLVRGALRVAMPWARSVIVCALNYNADAPLSIDPAPPATAWIARYAWTGRTQSGRPTESGEFAPTDYHTELLTRLRTIEAGLLAQTSCTTRCYVDTGPILERSFAARAGVGWIGKNTCVINQQLGSWLLLGVIVTSLPISGDTSASTAAPPFLPAPDRCGTCTRCIDACPTGALLGSSAPNAPREMDASRCIAYLTIEKKGPIDESLRAPIGRHVFGCDICQDVCPWNSRTHNHPQRRAPIAAHEGMSARPELINPALDWLASMDSRGPDSRGPDSREFKRRFKGSPLERTGRKRLLRNVAIAMGNSRDPRFLPQLTAWATQPEDPVLRESAAWAHAQIAPPSSQD
jgi:epoxyqueuosine reductase